jgi:AAA domain-containing protein/primase-like protein
MKDDFLLPEHAAWLAQFADETTNGATGHGRIPVEKAAFTVPEAMTPGQRYDMLFRLARSLKARGNSEGEILALLRVANSERCVPPHTDAEVERIAHNAWTSPDRLDFRPRSTSDTGASAAGEDDAPEATPKTPALKAIPANEVMTETPAPEIVRGAVWRGSVAVLVSESGAGKTFVVTDLGAAVSDGVPWHGRRTRKGSVLYVAFESSALGVRLRALRDVVGRSLENVFVLRASEPLSPKILFDRVEHASQGELAVAEAIDDLRAWLAAEGRPDLVLIIIDTVRQSLAGSEDNSEIVSAYLRAVRRLLHRAPEAAALLVHHSGWQDTDARRQRERGSSAWRGNVDGTLYLEVGEELERGAVRLTLSALKVRDGELPAPLHLIRKPVDIDQVDADGRPMSTCIIERDPRSRQERDAETQAAANAAMRAQDLAVLRGIADKPDLATSIRAIRAIVGARYEIVSDAVTRCIGHEWLKPGNRQQPYVVTSQGHAALAEAGKS